VILVDTSVWIDHFRSGNVDLVRLLDNNAIVAHPWVTGELALGNLSDRDEVIRLFRGLPQAIVADDDEVLQLIEREPLHGSGIGYVDAQLLASTKLTADTRLWTRDARLATVTERVGVGFEPDPRPDS
jgi:predicted nucleic acid-binding protein